MYLLYTNMNKNHQITDRH